ncbi:protein of unknown function [Pseudomonas sp. JV241A]|nr:protein of unknown function [Pseudomonas sp. JV241A]
MQEIAGLNRESCHSGVQVERAIDQSLLSARVRHKSMARRRRVTAELSQKSKDVDPLKDNGMSHSYN